MDKTVWGRMAGALNAISGGKVAAQFLEAATADDDDPRASEYRKITAGKRDLAPMAFERQREMAYYLWMRNPIARRLIGFIVEFCTGDDLQVQVRHMRKDAGGKYEVDETQTAKAQEVWADFGESYENNWEETFPILVQDLHIAGELVLPTFVRKKDTGEGTFLGDGFVELGYTDPTAIQKVTVAPLNMSRVLTLNLRIKDEVGEGKTYKVVDVGRDPNMEDYRLLTGEVIYRRINRSASQVRGHGFLIEQLDWLDLLDQFLFDALRGFQARNMFFWSVMFKGLDEAKLEEKKKGFTVPEQASARLHNENVEYKPVSPDLGAMEVDKALTAMQTFIVGAKGFPMTWFGTGEDANRASAKSMSVPTMRMLKAVQKNVRALARYVATYVMHQAVLAGRLKLDVHKEKFDVTVKMFDFEREDAAVLGVAFQQMVAALVIASSNGWVSPETAKQTVDGMLGRMGVEIPSGETVEDLKRQADERKAEEVANTVVDEYGNVVAQPPGGGNGQPGKGEGEE